MWWPIRWPTSIRGSTAAVDWDRTIAFREHLWALGLGVAEAMDTAQRGMGLDWPTSLELIRRSMDAAKDDARRAGRSPAPAPTTWRWAPDVTVDDVIARLRGADARRSRRSAAASS